MKILIAEDDTVSRRILIGFCQKTGLEPIEAKDGNEAWDIMQREDAPKLALLDWQMPGYSGVELCQKIRQLPVVGSKPFLILLSARNEQSDIVSGLESGADDYLTKPYDPPELRLRINNGARFVQLQMDLADRVTELEKALAEVRTLRGIVPICACCKKIRDDKGYWNQVENYLHDHSHAEFSHGICPDCMEKLYPGLAAKIKNKHEKSAAPAGPQTDKPETAAPQTPAPGTPAS